MLESGILSLLVHTLTSISIVLCIVISYKMIKKFKGGLFSKFFTYIFIGAIPAVLFHLTEALSFFGIHLIEHDSLLHMLIEHFIVLFIFVMILVGTFNAYKDYSSLTLKK